MPNSNIHKQLLALRTVNQNEENKVIAEAQRILNNDLVSEKRILENLGHYNNLFHVVNEEEVEGTGIFNLKTIKNLSIHYRLKFLNSELYKPEIPYEAILKIKELNLKYQKDLKLFKVLALPESFFKSSAKGNAILFAKTNHGNYYKIHEWGAEIPLKRKVLCWCLRNFETFMLSIFIFTLLETLSLPTHLITLDSKAEYWSGYRAGTFFHLLIFNSGFSAYFFLTFAKNFSSNLWNRKNDFD